MRSKGARDQPNLEWTQFSPADRKLCVGQSQSGSAAPSYSELESCLQMTRDARQLDQRNSKNPQAAPSGVDDY